MLNFKIIQDESAFFVSEGRQVRYSFLKMQYITTSLYHYIIKSLHHSYLPQIDLNQSKQ